MKLEELTTIIEDWAPREIAWAKDNVGLQIGNYEKAVRRILVALEVSSEVVAEARRKRVDVIVTHHPLLFHPLRSISASNRVGRLVHDLISAGIAVYSAHTNLDFTESGVSFALATRLGLKNLDFLHRPTGTLKKISVFVPSDHVEQVAKAMGNAGAGNIGDYEMCSFRVEGTGTFRARKGASPYVGEVGKFEKVREVRLEMLVPQWRVQSVISRMIEEHPYEEVAYDVYPLENRAGDVGAGAIGELERPRKLDAFLRLIRKSLRSEHLRYVGDATASIKRVAVCGGSGASLVDAAIDARADAFITADIKYHTFQEATGRIALIDAGHYETEVPVLDILAKRLEEGISKMGKRADVLVSRSARNPIQYH